MWLDHGMGMLCSVRRNEIAMIIKTNHFYKCENYHIFIFPDKEKASQATIFSGMAETSFGNYWSKRFKHKHTIPFSEKNSPFLVLELEDHYIGKVLFKNKVGWVYFQSWFEIKEVT